MNAETLIKWMLIGEVYLLGMLFFHGQYYGLLNTDYKGHRPIGIVLRTLFFPVLIAAFLVKITFLLLIGLPRAIARTAMWLIRNEPMH